MYRLYTKGKILSFRRSKVTQYPQISLVKVEGVQDTKAATAYLGKRVAYIYKAKKDEEGMYTITATVTTGKKYRVIWGKVVRPHGNSGVLRARFQTHLPAESFGQSCRVMLYVT